MVAGCDQTVGASGQHVLVSEMNADEKAEMRYATCNFSLRTTLDATAVDSQLEGIGHWPIESHWRGVHVAGTIHSLLFAPLCLPYSL